MVDSGASMHMVCEKDLNPAELETMRTSRSPTTVVTDNGEVQTRAETTVLSSNWTCSSKLCFLKKLPQYFPWGNSAKNMGTRITGKTVKTHISSTMARELIAIYQTMYHLWCLEYQRVLAQLRLHLLGHHLHHRSQHRLTEIQYRRTEVWKLQYQKEVKVRMKSFGETRCMNPQKPKTKIKIGNRKMYKEIYRINCLIGYRNSGIIWLMQVPQKSFGETWCREVHTLPVRLMNLP